MSAPAPLVSAYLARLEAAAGSLPPDRRAELVLEIRDHIAAAQAAGAADDEDALRAVLTRLGPPEEIAAAAREDVPSRWAGAAPDVLRRPGTGLELGAVLMLTLGSLVPVLGWLVGVALLWSSRRWRVREKLLGTLVVPFGPGGLLLTAPWLISLESAETCTGSAVFAGLGGEVDGSVTCTSTSGSVGWVATTVAVLLVVLPALVAVLLYRLARRRAAAEPDVLVPAPGAPGASPWGGLEIAGVLGLALGGLLVPIVGPLVGFVLVCSSPRWSAREKTVAGLLGAAPLLLLVLGLLVVRSSP